MKGILIVMMIGLLALVACSTTDERTLTTQGVATITVEPDEAEVYVVVETLRDSADEAREDNARIVEAVKTALSGEKLESNGFNIYEEYDYTQSGRKSTGFKATHTLKVTTEDFNDVGSIIDKSVSAGATHINGVNFVLKDSTRNQVRNEALRLAGENAREKAASMAAGLDLEVGSVKSVSDSQFDYFPQPYLRSMDAAEASGTSVPTNIEPKDLDVTASVQVVYTLK